MRLVYLMLFYYTVRILRAADVNLLINFFTSDKTVSTIKLNWQVEDTTEAFTSYIIGHEDMTLGNGQVVSDNLDASAVEFTKTDLLAGHKYKFSISLVYGSEPVLAYRHTTYITFIDNLQVLASDETTISLSWNVVYGGRKDSYTIKYTMWNEWTERTVTEISASTIEYVLGGLDPASQYEIEVVILQGALELQGATVNANTIPADTTGFVITGRSKYELSFAWDELQGTKITYILDLHDSSGNLIRQKDRTSTSWTFDDDLNQGSKYVIEIVARCGEDWSTQAYNTPISITTYTKPGNIPNYPAVSGETETNATLTWNPPTSGKVDGYRVQDYPFYSTYVVYGVSTLELELHHFEPGSNYEARIQAFLYDIDGSTQLYGSYTSWVDITTIPERPADVSVPVEEAGVSTLTVRWSAPQQGLYTGFVIAWKLSSEPGAASMEGQVAADATSYTINNLLLDTEYEISVTTLTLNLQNQNVFGHTVYVNATVGVQCSVPSQPVNALVTSSIPAAYKFRSKVMYQCENGFTLAVGDLLIICMSDRQWSGVPPQCQVLYCTTLSEPVNAVITVIPSHLPASTPQQVTNTSNSSNVSYPAYSKMVYSCEPGHILMSGDLVITCMVLGDWSGDPAICHVVNCSEPDTVPNATYELTALSYMSNVTYTCERGYEVVSGDLIRQCMEDGGWSGSLPSCAEITCSPPIIQNGQCGNGVTSSYAINSSLVCECEQGHSSDRLSLSCGENGQWEGGVNCTVVSCPVLSNISNSEITNTTGNIYGSIVEYSCLIGYQTLGAAGNDVTRQCAANGNWTGIEPNCTDITCSESVNTTNSEILTISRGFLYSSIIEYRCAEGYVYSGGNMSRECGVTGNWSGNAPVCTAIPTTTSQPSSTNEPSTIITTKENLATTRITAVLTTTSYKDTTTTAPTTVVLTTTSYQDTTTTSPTTVVLTTTSYQDATATAPTTSSTRAVSTMHSTTDEHNTNPATTLTSRSTSEIPDVTTSSVESESTTASITTTSSGPIITETVDICSNLTAVSHSSLTVSGLTYLSTAVYVCQLPGYVRTSGDLIRVCRGDGLWSGVEPVCEEKCPNPIATDKVTWKRIRTEYLERLLFECKQGYEHISGDLESVCTPAGLWTAVEPICFNMTIYIPPEPEPVTKSEKLAVFMAYTESDMEPSHYTTGLVGIIIMSVTGGLLLLLDMMTIAHKLSQRIRVSNL